MSKGRPKIVTGVIGDDVHVVGLRILEHALRSSGFDVASLGVMAPPESFVAAAIETNAGAVVISSSNGHADVFVADLKGKFVEAGLADVLLYLGGRLAVGRTVGDEVLRRFLSYGIDRVYPAGASLEAFIADLGHDLAERGWEVPSHAGR